MEKRSFFRGLMLGLGSGLLVLIAFFFYISPVVFGVRMIPVRISQKETTGKSDNVNNDGKLDFEKINQKLATLQNVVSNNFLFQEDMEKVEDGIYSGMMAGLGDPYTVYYNKKDFKALTESTSGKYSGIGAVVTKDPSTGIVTLMRVFDHSPAKEAGLEDGDILYKVNDVDVTSEDLDVLVSTQVRGEEGSKLKVTVLRGEDKKEIEAEVTRRSIEVPTVAHKMLDQHVGYLSVAQFDEVTSDQFKAAIDDLNSQGMQKLVIDLRDNPGGVLSSCVDMLNYLLPKGLLVYTADKDGKGDKFYSDDAHQLDIPIAILVNGNSASASEVFAGAMKDRGRAKIVGMKTFGKGIVQTLLSLQDGSAVKITTQHYYTPSGFDLHKKGIEPDVVVELNKETKTKVDNQLQEAIKALN